MRTGDGKKVNLSAQAHSSGYSNLMLGLGFKIGAGLHLNILSFKYFFAKKDYIKERSKL
jgi:hypothetical protein